MPKKIDLVEDDEDTTHGDQKWRDSFAFQIYEWTKQGIPEGKQAKLLGTYPPTFTKWKKTRRLLRLAIKAATKFKEISKHVETERRAIYEALPAELQDVWSSLRAIEETANPLRKIEFILRDRGEKARQHIFFHALAEFNFNVNRAMKICGISRSTLDKWVKENPKFVELVQEVKFLKGNFFEAALLDACARGESGAIVFANRTFNRDRGYNDKLELDVNQNTITTNVALSELKLSLACRKEILKAIREHKSKKPFPFKDETTKLITQQAG